MTTSLTRKIYNFDLQSGVYAIVNEANGRMYIGSTIDLCTRLQSHQYMLKSNSHHNMRLQHDYNNGCNFRFVILRTCPERDLLKLEQKYVKRYKKRVYNSTGCSRNGETSRAGVRVKQICPKTGEVIAVYRSQAAAARAMGVTKQNIHEVIKGTQGSSAGYLWEKA